MTFSVDDFARALEGHDFNFEVGTKVKGKPFSATNEGIFVDIGGKAAAFLPLKEITLPADLEPTEVVPLEAEREFLIIKGQDADGQVVLSIRQLEIKAVWERLVDASDEKESYTVRVTGTNKGGVTVDLQGIRGFIPRSHLLDRENMDSLVGQSINASLIEVDPDRKKLVLSHRLASQATRIQEFELNDLVSGTVRDLKPFGVFVDLHGITGLLHIQQISNKYVSSLDNIFQRGDSVRCVVVDLDPQRGRISLSTKVLEKRPGEMLDAAADVYAEAEIRLQKYLGESEDAKAAAEAKKAELESKAEPNVEAKPQAEAVKSNDAVEPQAESKSAVEPKKVEAEPKVEVPKQKPKPIFIDLKSKVVEDKG